jgi:hypothetical protein
VESYTLHDEYTAGVTIFEFDGKWWIFFMDDDLGGHGQETRLFCADSFLGANWTEHPSSPVRTQISNTSYKDERPTVVKPGVFREEHDCRDQRPNGTCLPRSLDSRHSVSP